MAGPRFVCATMVREFPRSRSREFSIRSIAWRGTATGTWAEWDWGWRSRSGRSRCTRVRYERATPGRGWQSRSNYRWTGDRGPGTCLLQTGAREQCEPSRHGRFVERLSGEASLATVDETFREAVHAE